MEFDEEELLTTARERYKEARTQLSAWREEARRCFDFRAGNQWTDEDKAKLTEQLRMPTTFNRIDPYCRAVAGLEAGNRQEIRYIPREEGDVAINEMYTETVRWIRDEAAADYEDADAFIDAFISGIGATESRMDYDNDPEGMVAIDHLDCVSEVAWDPNARKRNLTDRKYDFRMKRDLDIDELRGMFGDKADEVAGDKNDWDRTDEDAEPWDRNPETAYQDEGAGNGRSKKRRYTLMDYQFMVRESYYKVANPMTDAVEDMDEDKYKVLVEKLKPMGVVLQAASMKRVRWYRAFFVGSVLMEVGPAPCKDSSTRKFITAYRDRNRKMWYGIVRAMIDPQEWANKFFSQILHIINNNSKGGLLAESDAFVNPRQAEADWANPASVVLLKAGGLGKVKEREPAAYPAAIDQMMRFAIQSMSEVTGLPLEMLGMVDRQQAGVLEAERKKTGVTMLATLFDSFTHYHKDQGKLLLYYVQEYMSDGRLVRINGEGGQRYIKLMRQPDTVKFDVIVDEMPQSPNNKERVWSTMQVMLPILMNAGMPPEMLAEVVAYSPLPEAFSSKLKAFMAQRQQQMAQNPVAAAQTAKLQADVAKAQADAYATRAKGGLAEAQTAATIVTMGMDALAANAISDQMQAQAPAAPAPPVSPAGAMPQPVPQPQAPAAPAPPVSPMPV